MIKSWAFVIIQFTCLGLIAGTGSIIANGVWAIIELLGVLLGIWSVFAMKPDNLHITPDVSNNTQLRTHGPYSIIRHPMYASLILVSGILVLNYTTTFRLITLSVLVINLILKLNYEENLLLKKVKGYKQYMKKTYRFVPYIY